MVTGFEHTGLVVGDLEAMVGFYRDKLGLEVMREVDSVAPPEGDHTGIPGAHRTLVFMGKPGGKYSLELVYFIEPCVPEGRRDMFKTGSSHVCFSVEGLEQLHRRLSEAGVSFVTPPVYRRIPDGSRIGLCYAHDPEGNLLELMERTVPTL